MDIPLRSQLLCKLNETGVVMDILKLIKEDHQKTKDALEDLEKTGEKETSVRKKTWSTLEQDLLAHMKGEEEVFYPELEDEIEDKILEAIEEHELVRMAAKVLDDTPLSDKRWLAKLKVIRENIEHHIEEEETDVFDAAKKKFGKEDLDEMGKRFEDAKSGGKSQVSHGRTRK